MNGMANMIHEMHLLTEPFEMIENGIKKVEYRVNDEKRQKIKIGDKLIFYKLPNNDRKIEVKIINLKYYKDLLSMYSDTFNYYLYKNYDTPYDATKDTNYYREDEINEYGCVAIFFERTN